MEFYANYLTLARLFKLFLCVLFLFFSTVATSAPIQHIFYITHDDLPNTLRTINQHANDINMLIAQSYIINETGDLSGKLDPEVLQITQAKSIKLLAMITNSNFDPARVTLFLNNAQAQQKALAALLSECIKNQVNGIQLDFEMVPIADKDALTRFYQTAAALFHQHGFIVSFAIAPRIADKNFPSTYEQKLYTVWQGAYDFKILGAIADFVTLMTYDQHGEGTIPGPIASTVWDQKVLTHALETIPANKISLGVPTYSGLWYMRQNRSSKSITTHYDAVPFNTTQYIIKKFKPTVIWDPLNQIHYAIYTPNVLNRYLFIEDAASFKAKLALAKTYGLPSISVFRLGVEDTNIWRNMQNSAPTVWQFLRSLIWH